MEKQSIKERIKITDISEIFTFKKADYEYNRIGEKDGWYLFKMKHLEKDIPYLQFEFVKGRKVKGIAGKDMFTYPESSQFGTYGFYVCGTPDLIRKNLDRIKERKGLDIDIEYFKGLIK